MNSPVRSALALSRITLLQGLPPARLEALAQACRWQHMAAHQPLLLRAQDRGEVLLLVSGRVRVTSYAASGRQVTFRDLDAGEVIGDLAALDGQPRSADVITLEDSVVAWLERADFLALLQESPELSLRLMQRLAQMTRALTARVIDLSTLGVQSRLHIELLNLARSAGVADNRARIDPAPPHLDLAARVSTNREQVTRELNALVRGGLLSKEKKALIVNDVARLEQMVAAARGEAESAAAVADEDA